MKRILATILALCMVLSVLVVVPFIATADSVGVDENNLGATGSIGYQSVSATVAKGTYTDLETVTEVAQVTEANYEISTPAGLKQFATLVGNGATFEGKTVYLTASIDFSTLLSGVESTDAEIAASTAFNGIGSATAPFKGTFDGQGYEITKISLVNTVKGGDFGLFCRIENATIQNLRLTGSAAGDTYGAAYEVVGGLASANQDAASIGAIVGRIIGSATLSNIYSDYGVCYSQNNIYGGIIGSIGTLNVTDAEAEVTLDNITNAGKVLCWNTKQFIGGIVGDVHNKTTLTDCLNTAHVGAPNNTVGGLWYVGGLVGFVRGSAGSLELTNCENRGKVYANAWFGGLVGTTTVPSTFTNCTNAGVVEHTAKDPAANNKSIGGISGQISGKATLTNCKNVADMITVNSDGVGGLVGIIYGAGTVVDNCLNSGNVTGFFKNAGGLMGYVEKSLTLTNSSNTGNVTTTADGETINAGGLVGQVNSDANATTTVQNCLNSGTVTGFYYNGGGMIGLANTQKAFILNNCTNSGAVSTKAGGQIVGGLVGQVANSVVRISDCTNTANVSALRSGQFAEGTAVGGGDAGGMVGRLNGNNHEILNCTNNGAIVASGKPAYNNTSSNAGGMVGNSGGLAIVECVNNGQVTAVGRRVGGIVGNVLGGASNAWIKDCVNNAYVGTNDSNAGGIAGYLEASGTANGLLSDGVTVVPAGITLDGCTNNGNILAGGNAGGIAGVVIYKTLVSNCVNKGEVDGTNASGIVCQQATANPLTIQNCKNYSKIIDRTKATDHVDQNILDYKDANCVYTSTNNNDYVETAQWLGYQVTAVYTEGGVQYQDIRFVGTIDSLDYKSVGFNYKVTDTHGAVKKEGSYTCQYVYTELYAEGGNLLASNYRPGGYLFSLTVEKIPVSVGALTFNVETFALETAVNGSALIKGEEKTFHHVVGDKAAAYTANNQYTVSLGAPTVVYQSPSNMNQSWGYYQFPRFYSTPDGAIIANWNYSLDSALGGGGSSAAIKNAISYDGGKTWTPISDANAGQYVKEYTVPTEDGRYFVSFNSGGSYKIPKNQITSTVYATGTSGGTTYNVYLASDIANLTLTDANGNAVNAFKNPNQINMTEYYAETRTTATSTKTLNWNNMPVYGYIEGDYIILSTASSLMAISSRYGMVEKDGVLYYATYTRGFDPKNTSASFANAQDYHYGVFVFKSTDGGDTWNCISRITYSDLPAGGTYEDGPCEPVLNVMPDGSLVIVARTGGSWGNYKHPTVISRSTDGGVNWSKPTAFGSIGVLPQMLTLDCGVTIATYGRPSLFYQTTADASGQTWNAEVQITDLSPVKTGTTQYTNCGNDQSCYYTGLIAIDSDTALLIYTDFYHPDGNGGYTKAIMVRTIDIVAK